MTTETDKPNNDTDDVWRRAAKLLLELMEEAERKGDASISIRLTRNRGRWGKIRKIVESDN